MVYHYFRTSTRQKTIGVNKICAECDFFLLQLQNLNPYRYIFDWKTKKQGYMIHMCDNLNKEIHIPRTNFENSVKTKRPIRILHTNFKKVLKQKMSYYYSFSHLENLSKLLRFQKLKQFLPCIISFRHYFVVCLKWAAEFQWTVWRLEFA